MNVVVIGAQWGDEGKGKMVDYLCDGADYVVRFSGGANAGHTIVADDKTYKLHLIPSGIIDPDKNVFLGSGMVIDPAQFFDELAGLEEQGLSWQGRVFISERAHLVLPKYKQKDREMDAQRKNPIGTTGRGIGITYALKCHREGVRVGDMYDPDVWAKLDDEDKSFLLPFREKMHSMVIDLISFFAEHKSSSILFEGAQGILLDLDIGTYPYVSSGMSAAAGASLGGGVGPRDLHKIMGVFKAYSTRVGNGPFPTQFRESEGELENHVREIGREYGVTTGRARRCGYLDLVALRYACRANSLDSLILTHIDVYDPLEKVKVCVGYEFEGKIITDFPSSIHIMENSKPVLTELDGWKTDLGAMKDYDDFPKAAKAYVKFIEDFTNTPIDIVSVGYERNQTIVRKPVWIK